MSKNLPFEGLAAMCNVTDDEFNKAKAKAKPRKQKRTVSGTAITRTYESAVKEFKSKANVLSIARVRKTTTENVVHTFCRKTLGQRDAVRVTDLVLRAIS